MRQEELLLSLLLLTVCPPGYFGERCEEHCDCIHGLSCHHQTGACHCQKGWRGRHCDKREYLLGVYRGRFRLARTFLVGPELMTPPSCCSRGVSLKALVGVGAPDPLERWVALHHPAWPRPRALTENRLHRCSLLTWPLRRGLCPAVPVSRRYPLPSPDGQVQLSSRIHRLRL